MALIKELKESRYKELDAEVLRMITETPTIKTRDIAEKLNVKYGDVARSYHRLGIERPKGLQRKHPKVN